MERKQVALLHDKVENALKVIEDMDVQGIRVKYNNLGELTFTIKANVKDDKLEQKRDKEVEDELKLYAEIRLQRPDLLGVNFKVPYDRSKGIYKLVRYRRRARKNEWVIQDTNTGKEYTCSSQFLKGAEIV